MTRMVFNLAILFLSISFISCGGGDTQFDAVAKSSKDSTIGVRIVRSSTQEATHSVTEEQPVTVIATLKTSNKKPIENHVVTFSTTLGVLDPVSGSVLTDANGEARIRLEASTQTGAADISATSILDGESIMVKTGYSVTAKSVNAPESKTPNTSELGSINFVAATPSLIVLKGTGGTGMSETSQVMFLVRGNAGQPMSGRTVTFNLNTKIGGLSLVAESGTTDADGKVIAIVRAGSIPTSVRVTATLEGKSASGETLRIFTQSDMLTLSTGIADQNSFTLSATVLNPEAWNMNGVSVDVTARLADHYNNPVPDGTTVYFTAEGGSIQSTCLTKDGGCSVKWTSQNPRPSDHRVTILAHTIGNESFTDKNSDGYYSDSDGEPFNDVYANNIFDEPFTDTNNNGIFDEPFVDDAPQNNRYNIGESFTDHNGNGIHDGQVTNSAGETTYVDSNGNGKYDGSGYFATGETYIDKNGNSVFDGPGFSDLGEPFLDANENGKHDSNELFFDSNSNGVFEATGDGKYNGILCLNGANCSANTTVHVRGFLTLVMASSPALITVYDGDSGGTYASNAGEAITLPTLNIDQLTKKLLIVFSDTAGQPMPYKTTVEVSTSLGNISGPTQYIVPNTSVNHELSFATTITDADKNATGTGTVTIKVTTPEGIQTILTFPVDG